VVVSMLSALTLGAVALFVAGNTLPAETVESVNEDPLAQRIALVAPIVASAGAALVALRLALSAQADQGPSAARRHRRARAWLSAAMTLAALWFTVAVLVLGR
jgi:hypothetical protein